jgi:hypothetical protein
MLDLIQHPSEVNCLVRRKKGRKTQVWSWGHGWKDDDGRWGEISGRVEYDDTWCEPENDRDVICP